MILKDIKDFYQLLSHAVQNAASDIHLLPAVAPSMRLHGDMVTIEEYEAIDKAFCEVLSLELLGNDEIQKENFLEEKELDLSYEPEIALESKTVKIRCRINMYQGLNGLCFAIRILPQNTFGLEDVLPASKFLPIFNELCQKEHGLIAVVGPTGSGKSTTIAAMLNRINETRQTHIVTLEDPIEYVYKPRKALISQREVYRHTLSFHKGLRAALREDPDVIFVGEIRDKETMETALMAAETGHLVLTTLHTANVIEAVERIVQYFPPAQQKLAQVQLASCFIGIIAQKLFKRRDGQGRAAAFEILAKSSATENLIRIGEAFRLQDIMRSSPGMQTMSDAVKDLTKKNII